MKKFLSTLLTGFALFFSIPTVLILASWSAIPGDTLYSVKSSLEDVALALTKNTRVATAFSVSFTDRRFNEATLLLDKKGSTVGYQLLVAEAKQSQSMIVNQQDSKNGVQLVLKIEEYQAEIKVRQTEAQSSISAPGNKYYNPTPVPFSEPNPTPSPKSEAGKTVTIEVPIEVTIEDEDPEVVYDNLKEAYEELEDVKRELEEELLDMASENAPNGLDSSSDQEEAPGNSDNRDSKADERDDNKDKEKSPKDEK